MAALEEMIKSFLKVLGPDLEENTNTLQRKIELLKSRKDDVLMELHQEAYPDGKKRRREVDDWVNYVEDIIPEFETLKLRVQYSKFYERQNLSEEVEIMTKEVTELLEQSDFPKGLFLNYSPSPFIRTMLKALEDQKERNYFRIGIWGMEGVGKTTLSKLLLSNGSTFLDPVYQIRVSRGSSIYKLQSDIAQALKLDFSCENDVKKRAIILSEAFKRRGRSVLILDDVRKQIDVEKIGIPEGNNGCRLIIASQSEKVLENMNCQKIMKVNSVSEQENYFI